MIGSMMLADIARVPTVLSALAIRDAEIAAFSARHLRPDPGGRLYLYGCGDGLVAAECVATHDIVARTALDFLVYDVPRLSRADRVLAISMSGNVDRGVEGAEAALARGVPLAVLTNGDGGRLGAAGTVCLSLDIPAIKSFLPGTSTYIGTLFALMQIKAAINGEAAPRPPVITDVAELSRAAFAGLPSRLTGVRFLSAGVNRATAAHGAEKMVELTRFPTWSSDIEEFAHSQFWSADPGELIVYVAGNRSVASLASHSAAVMQGMGFTTLAIHLHGMYLYRKLSTASR